MVVAYSRDMIGGTRIYGVLYDQYGHRVVYDSGSKVGNKLSSVVREKMWCWPSTRSEDLVEIQSKIPKVKIENEDQPFWNYSKKGQYSCSQTWGSC